MDDGGFNTAYGTAPARARTGIPLRSLGLLGQRRSGARATGTCQAHVPVLLTPLKIGRHQ